MSSTVTLHSLRGLSALVAGSALLVACGGGSDAPSPPPPPPPPTSVIISGTAVDGPLQGATACYDIDDNKACDDGDPKSAASDTDGKFTISVLESDSGKHSLIVRVPVGAIDKDTGPVTTEYFLVAPATGTTGAQSVFVSPLTTLVLQQMDVSGQTLAQARDFVQAQAGLAVSPLADFTAAGNADKKAANVSALFVRSAALQRTAVAGAVDQTDLSGAKASQADVDKAVAKVIAEALPALGAAAADLAEAGVSGAALQTALTAAANTVVGRIGLTVPELLTQIGLGKLPPDTSSAGTPQATASLVMLQYTDANHWFIRALKSTAADNTPDANNTLRYADVRTRMTPYAYEPTQGVAQSFAVNSAVERAGDLHWNGSAWVACKLGDRNVSTVRDAQGRASYNFCDNFEKGSSVRSGVTDISGQSLATVIADKIRSFAGSVNGIPYAQWGPEDMTRYGSATFPAGSVLAYNNSTALETAFAYDVQANNQVAVFSAAVAAGGDARIGTVACANASTAIVTTNLEEMVARNPGKPCLFNQATNADGTSLNPNEAWGPTTTSLGSVPNGNTLPAGTGNYYTTTAPLRVAFTGANNATTYYQCYERRTPASNRNCMEIGKGTYSIATLGDARVMSFTNLPAAAQSLNFTRVFVERGGKVYFGYQNRVGLENAHVRLNLPAANAVLTQLGLPTIMPTDAPSGLTGAKATTMAAAKGVYGGADATSALVIRFGDNGEFLLAEVDPPSGNGRPGFEYGWFDLDPETQTNGHVLAIDTNGDRGLSSITASEGIASISETALTTKGGETFSRLTDSGSGLVGMWALGSATDLKVTHLVYFANGKRLSIHPAADQGPCVASRQGPPGIEWSDYTFNAATGALRVFNKIYDTSGCTGLFDSAAAVPNTESNAVITMAADQQTFAFTIPVDGGGTVTLTAYRIPVNP